ASPPRDQTNCLSTTANFGINATGTDLTYQWFKDSALIAGATSSGLSITNVNAANAGIYSVVISGTCGIPITNSASLTVNENTGIAAPPINQTNCPGTTATFITVATGTALVYQWYKDSTAITGATSSELSFTNVSAANAGIYSIVVSG